MLMVVDYIESATQGEIDNSAGDNAIIPLMVVVRL